jgi:riboflavin synthase
MFTGIVEELGHLVSASRSGSTTRLAFAASLVTEDVEIGDSIAVNGCCLTVIEHSATSFAVDAIEETLSRTNLGHLAEGEAINLERSLALGDRLGGHLVQGHVDGVGVIVEAAPHLCIEVPPDLGPYLVEKGSVTVDGCSLTIVAVSPDQIRIEIIPHTSALTTLGRKSRGALVNLEVDIVAKYVERLVRAGVSSPYDAPLTGRS